MVVAGTDVTEEAADKIYQRELKKVSRKFSHMRYHSFLMYFGVLKRLGWVEETGETETSTLQDNYPRSAEPSLLPPYRRQEKQPAMNSGQIPCLHFTPKTALTTEEI
jgi:hypothetical protein